MHKKRRQRVFNHIALNQDKYPDDYDPLHNSVGEYTISSMSYDRPSYYDDGGTPYLSGSVLQRWLGVVPEMDPEGNINPDTYYKGIPKSGIDNIDVKYISPKGGNTLAHMKNMVYLDKEYRDDIKKYIIKEGAKLTIKPKKMENFWVSQRSNYELTGNAPRVYFVIK